MTTATSRLRPTPAGIVSFVLVVAGLVLGATVDMAWLVLFAAGVFGPPLLREAGLLRDRDEFQRAAARLAGYRAYLVGGLFLVAVTVARSWGVRHLGDDAFSASASLTVMLVVYLISYLMSYWGAPRAAFRVLMAFGLFWLVFAVLGHGLSPELAIPLAFFALAFGALRWPRVTGGLLAAFAAFCFFFFDVARALRGNHGALLALLVLVLPLLATGLGLLFGERDETPA